MTSAAFWLAIAWKPVMPPTPEPLAMELTEGPTFNVSETAVEAERLIVSLPESLPPAPLLSVAFQPPPAPMAKEPPPAPVVNESTAAVLRGTAASSDAPNAVTLPAPPVMATPPAPSWTPVTSTAAVSVTVIALIELAVGATYPTAVVPAGGAATL